MNSRIVQVQSHQLVSTLSLHSGIYSRKNNYTVFYKQWSVHISRSRDKIRPWRRQQYQQLIKQTIEIFLIADLWRHSFYSWTIQETHLWKHKRTFLTFNSDQSSGSNNGPTLVILSRRNGKFACVLFSQFNE